MSKEVLIYSSEADAIIEKKLIQVFEKSSFKIISSFYPFETTTVKNCDLIIIIDSQKNSIPEHISKYSHNCCLVLTSYFSINRAKSFYNEGASCVSSLEHFDSNQLDSLLLKSFYQKHDNYINNETKEGEDRYRELVQHSKALICSHDLNGYIISTNNTFQEQIGYSESELIGYSFRDLINPKAIHELDEYFVKIRKDKEADGILNIITKQNQSRYWNFKNILIDQHDGNSIVICYGQDITDRIKVEKTLLRAQTMVKETIDFQQQFIKNISHQIRTPLNAIIGFTNQLISDIDPKQHKSIESLFTSNNRLLSLLESLENYSNLNLDYDGIRNNKFHPSSLLESIILFHRLKAEKKGLTFDYYIQGDQNLQLFGDTLRFNQIITHLLNNAIKFTDHGGISVKLIISQSSKVAANITLEISDTGIGIPHEFQKSIFSPFNKPVTHESTVGPGLGLAIVKSIVDTLGGTINIISAEGKGSVFSVNLDYKIYQESTSNYDSSFAKILDGLSVLICEDNEINQKLLAKIFEPYKIKLSIAHNGQQAIELANGNYYDLILMDLQMPIIDGYEATLDIRKQSNIPIIALTAGSSLKERNKCLENGFNDFLSKPIEEVSLFRTIAKCVESTSVLDLSRIDNLANGDQNFLKQTLQTFKSAGSTDIESLINLLNKKDYEKIKKQAHKLKSSFLMFGMESAAEYCENICNNIDSIHIGNTIFNIKRLFDYAHREIDQYLIKN